MPSQTNTQTPTHQNQPLEFSIEDTVLGSGAFSEVRLAQIYTRMNSWRLRSQI